MEDSANPKVLFILNPTLGHITAHSRGLIFRDILRDHGWSVSFVNVSRPGHGEELDALRESEDRILERAKEFDLIYLLRVSSYDFIKKLRRSTEAKLVFELSDALWRPSFRAEGFFNLEETLRLVDAVFTENELVTQYGLQFNDHVFNLTACTQTEKFDEARKKMVLRNDGQIIIGWIGTNGTAPAILSLVKPMERLSARFANVQFRIVGCDLKKLEKPLRNVRYTALANYNEAAMIREAINMDIGLFPAPGDLEDYRIRGPLKALVYMSAGIAPACLNAGDPGRIIEDGVNGILIDSFDQWELKLEKLILNPAITKAIGKRAYETVREKHSLEATCRELEQSFHEVVHLPMKELTKPALSQQVTKIVSKTNVVFMILMEKARRGLRKITRFYF